MTAMAFSKEEKTLFGKSAAVLNTDVSPAWKVFWGINL
jgi:hypothetical protein